MEIVFTKKSKIRCLEYQIIKKLFQQKHFLTVLFILMAFFTNVSAQTNVSGTVKDGAGNVLAGVSIKVEGQLIATSTNNEGKYSLSLSNLQETLVFTYVGFATEEVPLNGRTVVDVELSP